MLIRSHGVRGACRAANNTKYNATSQPLLFYLAKARPDEYMVKYDLQEPEARPIPVASIIGGSCAWAATDDRHAARVTFQGPSALPNRRGPGRTLFRYIRNAYKQTYSQVGLEASTPHAEELDNSVIQLD